jgi:hypothetical protein
MGAHLDCRRLAAFIQPCGQCHDISGWDSTVEERKNAGLMPVGGRLAVKLLRGFNLKNESEGAHVYGVFNIKGQLGAFSTNSAPVDSDKDVSWASKNMKRTSLTDMTSSDDDLTVMPGMFRENFAPVLEVSIWRQVMTIFDSMNAFCNVDLLPLFLYPRCMLERKFPINDHDGKLAGFIELGLTFLPNPAGPTSPSSSTSKHNWVRVPDEPLLASPKASPRPSSTNKDHCHLEVKGPDESLVPPPKPSLTNKDDGQSEGDSQQVEHSVVVSEPLPSQHKIEQTVGISTESTGDSCEYEGNNEQGASTGSEGTSLPTNPPPMVTKLEEPGSVEPVFESANFEATAVKGKLDHEIACVETELSQDMPQPSPSMHDAATSPLSTSATADFDHESRQKEGPVNSSVLSSGPDLETEDKPTTVGQIISDVVCDLGLSESQINQVDLGSRNSTPNSSSTDLTNRLGVSSRSSSEASICSTASFRLDVPKNIRTTPLSSSRKRIFGDKSNSDLSDVAQVSTANEVEPRRYAEIEVHKPFESSDGLACQHLDAAATATESFFGNSFQNIETSSVGSIASEVTFNSHNESRLESTSKTGDVPPSYFEGYQVPFSSTIQETVVGLFSWASSVTVETTSKVASLYDPALVSNRTKAEMDYPEGPGVGNFYIHLKSAMRTSHEDVGEEYYILLEVAGSAQEEKSKTIVSAGVLDFNEKMDFIVPYFGSSCKMSLIHNQTRRTVGSVVVSVWQLLVRDAENFNCQWDSSGAETFELFDNSGMCVGTVDAVIHFKEDTKGLFTSGSLHYAPADPDEELSVGRLTAQINRFGDFIDWLVLLYTEYCIIMDWQKISVTLPLFISFVVCSLYLNAEYALSAPLLILVVLMTRALRKRRSGAYRLNRVEKGNDQNIPFQSIAYLRVAVQDYKSYTDSPDLYSSPSKIPNNPLDSWQNMLQQPFVKVTLQAPLVDKFMRVVPKAEIYKAPEAENDNSSSGSASAKSSPRSKKNLPEDSQRVDPEVEKRRMVKQREEDKKKCIEFPVAVISPRVRRAQDSLGPQNTARLANLMNRLNVMRPKEVSDAYLLDFQDPWPKEIGAESQERQSDRMNAVYAASGKDEDISIVYPILQPFLPLTLADIPGQPPKAVQWSKYSGILVFDLHSQNPKSAFVNSRIGRAFIPVSNLVVDTKADKVGGLQPEVECWADVKFNDQENDKPLENGDAVMRVTSSDSHDFGAEDVDCAISMASTAETDNLSDAGDRQRIERRLKKGVVGRIKLRLQIDLRDSRLSPSRDEKAKSRALRYSLYEKNTGPGVVSTLWHLRDNVKYVQNVMGFILKWIESFKNLLNWTMPSKTYPFYVALICIFVLTVLIPGRYIILGIGIYQFGFKFLPEPEEFPLIIRLWNLFMSIPTDDDMSMVYKNDHEKFLKDKENRRNALIHWAACNMIRECQFSGQIQMRGPSNEWTSMFLACQGRRRVWWKSEEHIEHQAPEGQLLLYGHTGTTEPSPVDIREVGDRTRLVTIFGRDACGAPQKLTIVCESSSEALDLVAEINAVLGTQLITRRTSIHSLPMRRGRLLSSEVGKRKNE